MWVEQKKEGLKKKRGSPQDTGDDPAVRPSWSKSCLVALCFK
jgi:hypothetical protein